MESYPGWRRPTIPFNSNHHIHSLSVHVISHSSIHDSVFPVSPYEELCNGHACTCFLVHKCQCFAKVETNIWNGWLTAYVYFNFIQYCQISLFNMAVSFIFPLAVCMYVFSHPCQPVLLMALIFASIMVENISIF